MAKLRHTIQLPTPGASDVATREFSLKLGEAEPTVTTLAADATTTQFDVDPEVAVEAWLVDVDTSGNKSPESEHLKFTSKDTFAPPAPGALGILSVEQIG